jgi:hypothetical protein
LPLDTASSRLAHTPTTEPCTRRSLLRRSVAWPQALQHVTPPNERGVGDCRRWEWEGKGDHWCQLTRRAFSRARKSNARAQRHRSGSEPTKLPRTPSRPFEALGRPSSRANSWGGQEAEAVDLPRSRTHLRFSGKRGDGGFTPPGERAREAVHVAALAATRNNNICQIFLPVLHTAPLHGRGGNASIHRALPLHPSPLTPPPLLRFLEGLAVMSRLPKPGGPSDSSACNTCRTRWRQTQACSRPYCRTRRSG